MGGIIPSSSGNKFDEYFQNRIISGPIRFVFFPNVRGKTLYLFGDKHEELHGCLKNGRIPVNRITPIENFFDEVFRVSPPSSGGESGTKRDFFFEIPFLDKSIESLYQGRGEKELTSVYRRRPKALNIPLHKILTKFEKCFRLSKELLCDVKYHHTRFHYVDYRQHFEFGELETTLVIFLKMFKYDYTPSKEFIKGYFGILLSDIDDAREEKDEDTQRSLNRYIFEHTKDIFFGIDIGYTERGNDDFVPRLRKELRASTLKNEIIRWATTRLKEGSENNFEWLRGFFVLAANEVLASVMNAIFASMFIMDMYALARMFKSSLRDATEIWVYAGDLHITNYMDFLSFTFGDGIGPSLIKISKDRTDVQCLDFTTHL